MFWFFNTGGGRIGAPPKSLRKRMMDLEKQEKAEKKKKLYYESECNKLCVCDKFKIQINGHEIYTDTNGEQFVRLGKDKNEVSLKSYTNLFEEGIINE